MRVSIFYNVVAVKPQETELDKVAYMMSFSQELSHRTQIYRDYKRRGRKEKAKEIKITRFPAFCPCAILYDGKARQNVMGLTDLCFLVNILRNDRHVVMASRSVSGEGLHILIRYQLKEMELPPQRTSMTPNKMQKLYGKVFDYFAAKYQQKLGLTPDYNAGHIERLYIVSYDSELYYNPHAEALTIDLNEQTSEYVGNIDV